MFSSGTTDPAKYSAEGSFASGTKVLAKYSAESRSWKRATVVHAHADTPTITVRFEGYTDDTKLPRERVKLHEGKPSSKRQPKRAPLQPATQIPRATSPTEKVVASARACLSKLSPDNFDKLAATIVELDVADSATLAALVELMFERAISEQAFCPLYARLFARCAQALPPVADEEGHELTFRMLLLRRAQNEFESGGLDGEGALTSAERQRQLGATIFVGQLWLQGLLRAEIVHQCVRHVLDAAEAGHKAGPTGEPADTPSALSTALHADAVEIACTLVRVIGPACDASGAGRVAIDEYVARMRAWANDKARLPQARLRFKVMDVLDDRAKGWV